MPSVSATFRKRLGKSTKSDTTPSDAVAITRSTNRSTPTDPKTFPSVIPSEFDSK